MRRRVTPRRRKSLTAGRAAGKSKTSMVRDFLNPLVSPACRCSKVSEIKREIESNADTSWTLLLRTDREGARVCVLISLSPFFSSHSVCPFISRRGGGEVR